MALSASRRLILPLICSAPLVGAHLLAMSPAETASPVVAAIEQAVQQRIGGGVTVVVSDVSGVRLAPAADSFSATPEPSARIGAPVRFVLTLNQPGKSRTRVGEATAVVRATATAVRARRPIARGARLAADDVQMLTSDLSGRPLRPLPSLEEIVGARARHDIDIDALLTRADISAEPLVRAGEIVRARVRVDGVEVFGNLVAAESGVRGDVIRVVNQESRYALRARVTGAREVEVVNVP